MPRVDCDIKTLKNTAEVFRGYSFEVRRIEHRIDDVLCTMPLSTTAYRSIKLQLRNLKLSAISDTSVRLNRMANAMDLIAEKYVTTDLVVAGEKIADGAGAEAILRNVDKGILDALRNVSSDKFGLLSLLEIVCAFGLPLDFLGSLNRKGQLIRFLSRIAGDGKHEYASKALILSTSLLGLTYSLEMYKDYLLTEEGYNFYKGTNNLDTAKDAVNDAFEKAKLRQKYSENTDDKKGDSKNEKASHKFAEKGATIVGWEKSETVAQWRVKKEYKKGAVTGSSETALNKAQIRGGTGVGDYVYTDEKGKKHHATGVYAEVGASYSMLEHSSTGQIGSENYNFHGEVHGKVNAVSAEAGGHVAWTDKGPQINAGGSTESVAAEVGGSVGVKIAGADVGVKGSVKFGVGASGKIGFKDGHFVCDFSASLGIGFSAGIDIDIGGMVKTVSKKVCDSWNGLCKGFKSLGKSLKFW